MKQDAIKAKVQEKTLENKPLLDFNDTKYTLGNQDVDTSFINLEIFLIVPFGSLTDLTKYAYLLPFMSLCVR